MIATTLPYILDRPNLLILPPPQIALLAPTASTAWSLRQAAAHMRGRGGRRPHLNVVRRWCGHRGWTVELQDLSTPTQTARWTLRLPSVRLSREIITMQAWVEWFERTRLRLSTLHVPNF